MKAILRWGAAFFGLLLLGSVSHAYYWVTPVTRCPYPIAPSPSNSGFYLVDPWGRLTGPHYYLVPPCKPFNGFLPGPIGQAIMSGNLPHTLLMSKQAMTIGDMPMLGKKQAPSSPSGSAGGSPMPAQYGGGPMPNPYMQSPYGPPQGAPYPMPYPPPMAGGMAPPNPGNPQFGPMQQFGQFGQFQQFGQFNPMQLPQMQYPAPPPPRPTSGAFPTHPFTRSPRDFFMWGESMDDERARGNRPFPVP